MNRRSEDLDRKRSHSPASNIRLPWFWESPAEPRASRGKQGARDHHDSRLVTVVLLGGPTLAQHRGLPLEGWEQRRVFDPLEA